jgi:hypothetical protein
VTVVLLVLAGAPVATAGRPAMAAGGAKDDPRTREAMALYRAGKFEEAAQIFAPLTAEYPKDLFLLRNLGLCFYRVRKPEEALANLREYLYKKRDAAAEDRQEVQGWIAEMEALRAEQMKVPPASGTPAPAPVAPAAAPVEPSPAHVQPAPPVAAAPSGAWVSSPQASAQTPAVQGVNGEQNAVATSSGKKDSGAGNGTLAAVAVAVGVVGVAAGVTMTMLSQQKFDEVEKIYDPDAESSGKTMATLSFVGYGVGAAALVTAIMLYSRDDKGQATGPRGLAILPSVNGTSLGAVLGGKF